MHSDLEILGRYAGSSPPNLSSALGTLSPVKFQEFPPTTDLGTGSVGVSTEED